MTRFTSLFTLAAAAIAASAAAPAAPGPEPAAAPPAYSADLAQSRLGFTGTQAGASFQGAFHKFTATVRFSPDALAASQIDVHIDLASLDTQDKDRDETMRGADIFDVAHWPTAHYVTHGFAKTAAGYTATGTLTLRGVSREVPLELRFAAAPPGARLEGGANLKRLDFGVGQGQWKSTEMVGDAVKVAFSLVLKPVAP
jgi:polyisoprenoid-binding protein YceI